MERNIRPDYYTGSDYECIDVLKQVLGDKGYEGFCIGNAFKYLWRYGEKTQGKEDLIKARTYLDFLIDN